MGYKLWIIVPGRCYVMKLFSSHLVDNTNSFNADSNIIGGSKSQPNIYNNLKVSVGNIVASDPNRSVTLTQNERDYTCFKCGKNLTYRISQPTVQDIQNRATLSARPERELNFVTTLRTSFQADQINECLRAYRAPYCTREFSSKRRYVIPCKDIHSLLRLLCSFLNGRCYVRLDELLIRKSLQCELDLMLDLVIKNVRVCQERYDILIDVALAYYIAAIKNFKFLADDKDLAGMAASAAANTASLGIESAVQVVGNVAAGAAISAIMDVAISTATIYIAKRKKDEGIISDKEFNTKIKKTVCQSSLKFVGGTAGSVIGQAFIPVPVVGALVGGLCGSLIGTGIGIGINYGVFDRLEKSDEKDIESKQKEIRRPKESSLYEKLASRRIPKTTIYKEREKQFDELVFPLELPKKNLTAEPNTNLSKSPKKEIFSFLKKKQLALEPHNEPETSVLVLRRLKRNKAQQTSLKTEKVSVSKTIPKKDENENSVVNDENKPQRTFLESFRRKSPVLTSNSDEENIPPKSNDNENESVTKNHVKVNRHETASRAHSSPLEQVNNSKNRRKISFDKNRSDTLPETRKFGFNFNFKDSFRSLSFVSNENEKTLGGDAKDIRNNEEQKGRSKPILERASPVEELENDESIDSQLDTLPNNSDRTLSLETDERDLHLRQTRSFESSVEGSGSTDESILSHVEHSDSSTSDGERRSPSPSMFKKINLNTFRRSFHSVSLSTNDLRPTRKPVLKEQKSDNSEYVKSDKPILNSENNTRRPFKRANTETNIRINVKYGTLGKLAPGFTQSADNDSSRDVPNTKNFFDSCRLHVEQKRMDLAERKKRPVSAGEENMTQYAKDHYMNKNIFKESPKRERKRSNSTPHMHTAELTDKVKNIINEQKQKIENEIFTTSCAEEGRKSAFSNVKNFFDSFGGKSGKKV